ncbi:hypothetical protein [Pedobacter sp. UC225_65]|uniref:hypothetical protein n=1 Tax=Pedobacter sp. UC225_65 TaxID=3350173 RepID=UPI00366BC9AA
MENTIRIVFKDNQRLYIIPRIKVDVQDVLDENGKKIGEKGVYTDTSYIAYAWNIGDKKGLQYKLEKFQTDSAIIVPTDSILQDFGFTDKDFASFDIDLPPPESVIKNGTKKIEKYPLQKKHFSGVDSIYRYYDTDLKHVDFSFSKKNDEQNNSKLYKIAFIFNKIPKGVFLPDMEVPRRESFYEMVIGSDKDMDRLEKLFKKAKSDRALKLGFQ